jgi:hypothetical protein
MADQPIDRKPDHNAGKPRDAGKTSGGGSLGHDQPKDVAEQTDIRNDAGHREDTGRQKDPVMPDDESTLNTKI